MSDSKTETHAYTSSMFEGHQNFFGTIWYYLVIAQKLLDFFQNKFLAAFRIMLEHLQFKI